MKLFLVCVVIKIVVTVGTSSEVKLSDTNRGGSGIKRFTFFKHNYTNINHNGNRARYVYETNKVGHNVKENFNIKKLFKLNGNSKNRTKVKYIKIVRYVPVRVQFTGRDAKDHNIAETNLDDYNTSVLNNQKEVHINDKFMTAKSDDALSTLIAKYFISKNGNENHKLAKYGKESYKLDIKEFIQYLQSLGLRESEISKYEELLQKDMGIQGTLNQQYYTATRKQNEYQNVIPLNYGVTGVKEVGILNNINSDATRVSEVPSNVKVDDKEIEQDTPQAKLNEDFNLKLKNLGKTEVMEVPINGNTYLPTQQEENPKLLFDVVPENQLILPNNTNAVAQQQNLEVIDVKGKQPSNLLEAKELNGTQELTEPKSQLIDDKETLLQEDEKNKSPDLETNGNVTDIDFYDYQEKIESDSMIKNKPNKSHNDNLMNTTDKYTNVSLEIGVNLTNKGPESLEIIKLPYTTLKDGLLDTETNNPLKELHNQYVKTGNVDFDDLPSEKPNLTSIFDVQLSGQNLVPDNEGRNAEINQETTNLVENIKEEQLNNGSGEITELRMVLSAILITLKSIFKELSLFEKQPKLFKLMEILTAKIDDNHINLNGLQNFVKFIRNLQDFDRIFTEHHFKDSLNTRAEEINEVLTNAIKILINNGVSNYELKHIVKESLLSVITGITTNRVKECEEKVWNEVRHDLELALYRSILAFTVNSN